MSDVVERLRALGVITRPGEPFTLRAIQPWLKANTELRQEAADELARLRALNEELVGALVQVRARFQHFNLGPDEAATMKRVNDAITHAKGGSDAR